MGRQVGRGEGTVGGATGRQGRQVRVGCTSHAGRGPLAPLRRPQVHSCLGPRPTRSSFSVPISPPPPARSSPVCWRATHVSRSLAAEATSARMRGRKATDSRADSRSMLRAASRRAPPGTEGARHTRRLPCRAASAACSRVVGKARSRRLGWFANVLRQQAGQRWWQWQQGSPSSQCKNRHPPAGRLPRGCHHRGTPRLQWPHPAATRLPRACRQHRCRRTAAGAPRPAPAGARRSGAGAARPPPPAARSAPALAPPPPAGAGH